MLTEKSKWIFSRPKAKFVLLRSVLQKMLAVLSWWQVTYSLNINENTDQVA